MKASSPHTSRAHRRRPADPLRKATYQLRASVVDAIRAAVEAGEAPSANVFVERAIEEWLREMRRARVYAAYDEAAEDVDFMEEVADTDRAFEPAVGDGLR